MKSLNIFVIGLLLYPNIVNTENEYFYSGEQSEFPQNDFLKIFQDTWKKLGADKWLQSFSVAMRDAVQEGQRSDMRTLEIEWKMIQKNPRPQDVFFFALKAVWAFIVHSFIELFKILEWIQVYILRFMRHKCDTYLGKDSPYHPWALLDSDPTQVSFLIFVYGLAVSLILMRFLTWFQYSVFLAVSFMAHSFGGPHMVFKWLVFVTGTIWFLFDLLIAYPFHFASVILLIFVVRLLRVFASKDSLDSPRAVSHQPIHPEVAKRIELRDLEKRVERFETAERLLSDRVDRLVEALEGFERS